MSEMPDDAMPVGTIEIHYYLRSDGIPVVRTDLPDFQDIAMVTQLGMLEFARLAIIEDAD